MEACVEIVRVRKALGDGEAPKGAGVTNRDLEGEGAAPGESEEVDLPEPQRSTERVDVLGDVCDAVTSVFRFVGAADPALVEEDESVRSRNKTGSPRPIDR